MMIKWLEDAIYDLQALRQYIALNSPASADRVAHRIISVVGLLSAQANIGRRGRVPNTRELVISGTPYIIPYRVKNSTIEVLRVFHSAMQWPEII